VGDSRRAALTFAEVAHRLVNRLPFALFFQCRWKALLALQGPHLPPQFMEAGQARGVDGGGYRTARFILMTAVTKAALRGELRDIREDFRRGFGTRPGLQFADAWGMQQQPALR